MSKGFDCATPVSYEQAVKIKAAGYDFIIRYYPSGFSKSLTKEEADNTSKAGLKIIAVFETTADRALSGYQGGLIDGGRANQIADAIGQTANSTIYFTVDFEVTDAQMSTVVDYIKGCSAATPKYTTGVYGSADVIDACVNAQACSHFWQTYAWSDGRKAQYLNLYQYQNGVNIEGIDTDLDEGYGNEGWFSTTTPVPVLNPISVEDANYMINRWIGHEYDLASPGDQLKRHYCANLLRKLSGQEVTQ